jgi:hypothetical protein
MAHSLAGPDRRPEPAPPLLDDFTAELPKRYAAVDGQKLEDDACRSRCGCPNPSFAQLHSRRRLLTAVDPVAMLKFMEAARDCAVQFRDSAEGDVEQARVDEFFRELEELAQLDLTHRDTGAASIRRIQTVYFNKFMALMDDIRRDEVKRVQEEEAMRKLPSADWFLPPSIRETV